MTERRRAMEPRSSTALRLPKPALPYPATATIRPSSVHTFPAAPHLSVPHPPFPHQTYPILPNQNPTRTELTTPVLYVAVPTAPILPRHSIPIVIKADHTLRIHSCHIEPRPSAPPLTAPTTPPTPLLPNHSHPLSHQTCPDHPHQTPSLQAIGTIPFLPYPSSPNTPDHGCRPLQAQPRDTSSHLTRHSIPLLPHQSQPRVR